MSSGAMALRLAKFALQNGPKFRIHSRCMSAIVQPQPAESKQYPGKITNIVSEISKLTLIEVADLNELLKKTLNIQDAPIMAAVQTGQPASAAEDDDDGTQLKKVQTAFSVKLMKFDEPKKIPLIKGLNKLMEGSNLIQTKKFVESAPQVVKGDLTKEEAEELKKTIESFGGVCEIV